MTSIISALQHSWQDNRAFDGDLLGRAYDGYELSRVIIAGCELSLASCLMPLRRCTSHGYSAPSL
jgi:hypothetical protein